MQWWRSPSASLQRQCLQRVALIITVALRITGARKASRMFNQTGHSAGSPCCWTNYLTPREPSPHFCVTFKEFSRNVMPGPRPADLGARGFRNGDVRFGAVRLSDRANYWRLLEFL